MSDTLRSLDARDVRVLPSPPGADFKVFGAGGNAYAVWRDGRGVWAFRRGRFLKGGTDRQGYRIYLVGNYAIKFHRLMLIVFVRPPVGYEQCRHLDGDPSNNHIDNLCWGTGKENWADKRVHGTDTCGERSGRSKLTPEQVREIRKVGMSLDKGKRLAAKFAVSEGVVHAVQKGKTWRNF